MQNASRWTSYEWRWVWRHIRPFIWYEIAIIASIVIGNTAILIGPLLIKWLIDDGLPNRRWSLLFGVAALLALLGFIRMALFSAAHIWSTRAVCKCVHDLRVRLLTHLLTLSLSYYDRASTGDLVERIERDTAFVTEFGGEVLPSGANMMAQVLLTLVMMLYLDWRLTAIIVPLLVSMAAVRNYYGPVLHERASKEREAGSHRVSLITEILSGVSQIQLLGAERRLIRRYALLNLRHQRTRVTQRASELIFCLMAASTIEIGSGLIVVYGGIRVLQGSLTPGGLVAFYTYTGTIILPIVTVTQMQVQLIRMRACINRLLDIERAKSDIQDSPDAVPLARRPQLIIGTNVAFRYAPDKPAISGVDFDARAGDRVAIVGPSGCGKSSLLQLIPRLYDAVHGRVDIDGRNVRAIELNSLRRAISFVPQHSVLFEGTLRDNLRHGAPMASVEEIRHAIDVACLGRVVARLPRGLDTELGSKGAGLSGGERQRLALARAILQDRPILILDEATSAIDEPTEHELLHRLRAWSTGRVVLIVSHRPSAARWADRVLVFDHGRLVEDGTHDALFVPGTFYYEFWHARESTAAQYPRDHP
jgi:ABC-type multidrug transport system fused ATPase/permease subunit